MKEYIERKAVHELVKNLPRYQMFSYDRTKSVCGINPDDVAFGVDKIPAADVVPVVRCRECRNFEVGNGLPDGSLCLIHGHRWTSPRPDDFCSRGERRTDG